jgi:hypothetical protein
MLFPSNETTQALEQFGCLTPNCRQSNWEISQTTISNDHKIEMGIQWRITGGQVEQNLVEMKST